MALELDKTKIVQNPCSLMAVARFAMFGSLEKERIEAVHEIHDQRAHSLEQYLQCRSLRRS